MRQSGEPLCGLTFFLGYKKEIDEKTKSEKQTIEYLLEDICKQWDMKMVGFSKLPCVVKKHLEKYTADIE